MGRLLITIIKMFMFIFQYDCFSSVLVVCFLTFLLYDAIWLYALRENDSSNSSFRCLCAKAIKFLVTFLGRLLLVDLITYEGEMSIRRYVHLSTKTFSDFNEIWYVDRGRWVIHDGMLYDPIQGQGHEASEVPKIALFQVYLLHHLQ